MYYNRVILVGFVGQDPDVRYYGPKHLSASFSLATTEPGYTRPTGEVVTEQTDWHLVQCAGASARFVEDYVRKGSYLLIEGQLRNRTYTDKNGVQHTQMHVFATRVVGLSRTKNSPTAEVTAEVQEMIKPNNPAYEKYVAELEQEVDDLPF